MNKSTSKPHVLLLAGTLVVALVSTSTVFAQQRPDPATLIAVQREAMQSLAFMDGVWRGQAHITAPDGSHHEVSQTERIGPLLEGSIKLIEGRGYSADGSTGFNAFAILSYDPTTKAYNLRSYTMGQSGDFKLVAKSDGYVWEIPAGLMTIRYTATFKDGVWHQVGERIAIGKPPVQFFEMTLHRLGDSPWPAAGAIPAQ